MSVTVIGRAMVFCQIMISPPLWIFARVIPDASGIFHKYLPEYTIYFYKLTDASSTWWQKSHRSKKSRGRKTMISFDQARTLLAS
jgi:hypothetical protein